jgi:hypothetical protein
MWAAFCAELHGATVPFGCVTLDETRLSHALFTAALQSEKGNCVVKIDG